MLLNLYFSIIIIILIPMDIAVISDTNLPEIVNPAPKFRDEIYRLLREVNKQNEQRIFENIYEKVTTEPTERDMNLNEMKSSLMKLLSKVNKLEDIGRYSKDVSGRYSSSTVRSTSNSSSSLSTASSSGTTKFGIVFSKKKKRNHSDKWGKWTDWSSCSVTCGKGRKIRWRHCALKCDAETEMEEISCQLPACSPAKLFGVIPV